jgi:hypothetical protein
LEDLDKGGLSLNNPNHSEILSDFLNRWPRDVVSVMTLEEYVSVGDQDTFCQWVETKTKMLGSIKGMTSIKFGIYKRKPGKKGLKYYSNDELFTWRNTYGINREDAFDNVKSHILKIIEFSERGRFTEIDKIDLPDLFKWKVAFLFSGERLIPVFNRIYLFTIASRLGMSKTKGSTVSQIQSLMISQKPSYFDVYGYMQQLIEDFVKTPATNGKVIQSKRKRHTKRVGSKSRNITPQKRVINASYQVSQKHNKIQEALKDQLIAYYGEDSVILEENYVDVKLIQPDYLVFYEVKSSAYASDCIKEALGQVLLYALRDEDHREKRLVVVGQYPPNESEKKEIYDLKKQLHVDFDYIFLDIDYD